MTGSLCLATNLMFAMCFFPAIPEEVFGAKTAAELAMERFPGSWVEFLASGNGESAKVGDTVVVEYVVVDSRGVVVADTGARGMPFSVRVEEGSDWHLLSFGMKPGESRRVTYHPASDKNSIYTVTIRLVRFGK